MIIKIFIVVYDFNEVGEFLCEWILKSDLGEIVFLDGIVGGLVENCVYFV